MMDPSTVWQQMSEAVEEDDWERAAELADDLLEWLRKGGFPPCISGQEKFDRLVALRTAQSVAAWDTEYA